MARGLYSSSMKSDEQLPAESPVEIDEARLAADGKTRLGMLEDYIGYHLRIAQAASFRAFSQRTGRSDVKAGWLTILMIIAENPGIAPVVLSRAAGRDKSTLTPMLRDLIKRNYLVKEARASDRRSYGLNLTPEGRERLAELVEHAAAHDRELDRIIGTMKPKLIKMLRKIATELG